MNTIRLLFILCICLLTACASQQRPKEMSQNTPEELAQAQKGNIGEAGISATNVSSWEISGALAAKNTKKGWSATLNWRQQGPNQYQIRLLGPLGSGAITIEKHGTMITFIDGQKRESSTNPDALFQKQTGIRLPVQNLYYWVRGLPAPGKTQSIKYDAQHQVAFLSQAGYSIKYADYVPVNKVMLPTKIQLIGRNAMIKLVISRWKI